MASSLTILQIIPRMRAGGAEMGCLQIAEAQIKAGHRALVASEGGRLVERLEAAGARHITLPLSTKNPLTMWANARALARIVATDNVDILHARSRAPAWSTFLAARWTGAGFVTTYHGEYSEKGRIKNLYNSVMARSDIVIAVSSNIAQLIRERYGVDDERVRVIPRAFDPARFDRKTLTSARIDDMREKIGVGPGRRVMMLAGRISENKSHADLIEAVGILRQQGIDDLSCVFPGEVEKADYAAGLKSRAEALGFGDHVHIAGNIDDMAACFALADIVFNISRTEGLPRVVIEAQAMRIPVVVSDSGPGREVALTPPDTPLSEATGLRVPYGNPTALAAATRTMLGWPKEQLREMGERGQAHAFRHFTLQNMCDATLRVYEAVALKRNLPRHHP